MGDEWADHVQCDQIWQNSATKKKINNVLAIS